MKAIIVGAGIGGLTAAIALRRVGWEVAVYERAPELREVGAGISLWCNALRALDHLGAGDAVRAVCQPLTRSELRTHAGRQLVGRYEGAELDRQIPVAPFIGMCHRAELVGTLAGHLPAESLHFGRECVSVEQQAGRATVRFADGSVESADVVVGADGIQSRVRVALLGDVPPRYAGYTCWRGICPRPDGFAVGYVGEWWGRGQRFGLCSLPDDRVY